MNGTRSEGPRDIFCLKLNDSTLTLYDPAVVWQVAGSLLWTKVPLGGIMQKIPYHIYLSFPMWSM